VEDPARAYYSSGVLHGAGRLLGDARCDAIVWNGSAGGLAGFVQDRALVAGLERGTGARATTSSLAILDLFARLRVRRFAMVTLNPAAANRIIAANFAAEGFECMRDTHRDDIADNFAMAAVTPAAIADALLRLAESEPDVLLVYGTNTRGAPCVLEVEHEIRIPVIDSVVAGLWDALRLAGVPERAMAEWGMAYRTPA